MTRSPHIQAAHDLWKKQVLPSDTVIDATAGNGNDTLFLSTLLTTGKIYAFDIQEKALQNTKEKLKNASCNIEYILSSHANFPSTIQNVRLIVYNLGYLPGQDKSITTQTSSTLESLNNALPLLVPNGAISITLYPGHAEGAKEAKAVLEFVHTLPNCHVEHYTWGENPLSPSLLWIRVP